MTSSFLCVAGLLLMVLRNPLFSRGSPVSKIDDLEVCDTQVCRESARFLLDAMDTRVDPCDDFYRYACGAWIEKNPIPEGRRSHSVADRLNDNIYRIAAESLRNATNENHPKAVIDAAILFQGCLDEGARERQGLNPVRNILNSVGGWPMINPQWNNTDYKWYKQVARLKRTLGIEAIISVDTENMELLRYIIALEKPPFGIENKYLENQTSSERTQEIISAYRNFIISTGKLLNPSMDEISLGNDADEIIQFESDLVAKPEPLPKEVMKKTWYEELMDFVERIITQTRSPPGFSSKHTISDVQRMTQNEYFKWTDFLNDVLQDLPQVSDNTEILSFSLEYLKHAVELVHDTDPRIVANYIGWILLKNIGHHSTKDFRDNALRFRKTLDEETENLEKSCVKEITDLLNFAVGRLYIDKFIDEEEMLEVEQLVEDIRSTFEVNFNHNDWMDPSTKQKALEKLRNMANIIGYPHWIKIDSELNDYYRSVNDVRQDEYFESFVRVKAGVEEINLRKWNQRIHRTTDWIAMSLLEVNAMYSLEANAIYFPAALFNSPIYEHGRPAALNYAGLGSYIAHEITHGFDSQGHRYDKDGNVVDWWSADTKRKFEEKVECLNAQYSEIVEPMTNRSLSVMATQPDDISDNGAVRNSFMAYKIQVLQAEENEVIKRDLRLPGLSATPEQLYFLGLASLDCTHHTNKSMNWILDNDSHSPAAYRVNMPLRNSRAFANAFSCPLGSPMNPELKCQLW